MNCFLSRCQGSFRQVFDISDGLLPVSTTGKARGGGQLVAAASEAPVTFGFDVKSTGEPKTVQGRCLVRDRASDTQVECLDARNYEQFGNTATWEGTAEVNGVPEDYRIRVEDNGDANQGLDTFTIETESYAASGPVERGDVQIHE